MEKSEYIANKMKLLIGKENYDRNQAYQIALSLWNRGDNHAQQGGQPIVDDNSHLKNIYNIQQGVTSPTLGRGMYINYRDPSEPGFSPSFDRDFVTNPAFQQTVMRSPAYQDFSKRQAQNLPFVPSDTRMADDTFVSKSSSNLKPIHNVQTGVRNDKLGQGVYIYYKDRSDPNFNYKNDRDFVTNEAFKRTVMGTSEYQKYSRGKVLQQGGDYYAQQGRGIPFTSEIDGYNPPNYNYNQPPQTLLNQNMPAPTYYDQNPPYMSLQKQNPTQSSSMYSVNGGDSALNMVDKNKQSPIKNQYSDPQYNTRYNIDNPYGGMDLGSSLAFTGQAFGQGNVGMGVAGAGLTLLKGAREFMTGFSSGKENQRAKKEYFDKTFNGDINYEYAQQGGKISNSQMLTGKFVADEGQGNTNVEGDEYIQRVNTGEVQQVVGEPHIKNGKKAEGVDINLNEGDKVLSNYTKIPAKNVKELKERYQLTLKKNATFADAQKAYDKKLGIQKTTDELTNQIEKLGKNEEVKDETAKRLNELVLTKEIEAQKNKLDVLKDPQSMVFENLFAMQEALPKLGNGSQLFDKNGKEVAQEGQEYNQQGGIQELAKKHGISHERAMELINMQQGGQAPQQDLSQQVAQMLQQGVDPNQVVEQLVQSNIPQDQAVQMVQGIVQQLQGGQEQNQGGDQMQQVYQAVAKMLQDGTNPEQVAQQLVQGGIPEEQVGQIIQQVAQQLQGQSPKEEQMEGTMSNPQEDSQEMAQQGLQIPPTEYSFSTRYTPKVAGYDVMGNDIIPQDTLSGVESTQHYTGQGYGAKMADVNKFTDTHKWYFDTEKKINDFKEAVKKEGKQKEIEDFQKAYDDEIKKRAEKVNITKTEINNIVNELGFNDKGVQQKDGLFGAFTSTRPLVDFKKTDTGEVKVIAETPPNYDLNSINTQVPQERTESVMPWLPQALRIAPSSLDPIAKEQIFLPRQEPIKQTTEPYLAEQERQRQTDVARVQASGLTPQQQEAMLASGLATSQNSANDAISKVENYNAQNQFATDQFNLNQVAKEDITNAQYRQDYERKVMQSLANQERDWRNYYQENYLDSANKFKYIDEMNWLNTKNDQFQNIPGQGIKFLNNKGVDYSDTKFEKALGDLTVAEREEYKKAFNSGLSREDSFKQAKLKSMK